MQEVAEYIRQVVMEGKDPGRVRSRVRSFRKDFQRVRYCFDGGLGAYEYVRLR